MDVPSSGPPAAPEQAKGINSAALPGRRWVQGGRAGPVFLPVVEGAEPLHLLPRSGICCGVAAIPRHRRIANAVGIRAA